MAKEEIHVADQVAEDEENPVLIRWKGKNVRANEVTGFKSIGEIAQGMMKKIRIVQEEK